MLLTLSGCERPLALTAFEGGRPQMRPDVFFDGETSSSGVLEAPSGAPLQRFRVVSKGRRLADGRFQLDQTIRFEGEAPRRRRWTLASGGEHRYTGALTDAAGTVRAEAYGDLFHLVYRLKSPPLATMEQWLYLQPDGRTVVNIGVVRLLGVPVRRLSERITREGDPPRGAGPPAD